MNEYQALDLLAQASAMAPMNLASHQQVANAVKILKEYLDKKSAEVLKKD